jgi:riboflavin biosynthesis pyrimidine reductase
VALRWLREQWNVKRLLCEGGGELNDALFRAGLVDEINLTICPKIFGGRAAPTLADGKGFGALRAAARFQLQSRRQIKGELFTVYSRQK